MKQLSMALGALMGLALVALVMFAILFAGCSIDGEPDRNDPAYFTGGWSDDECRARGGHPVYDCCGNAWCKRGRADPEGPEAGASPGHRADGGVR